MTPNVLDFVRSIGTEEHDLVAEQELLHRTRQRVLAQPVEQRDSRHFGWVARAAGAIAVAGLSAVVVALFVVGDKSPTFPVAVASSEPVFTAIPKDERVPLPEIDLPLLVPDADGNLTGPRVSIAAEDRTPYVVHVGAAGCEVCARDRRALMRVRRSVGLPIGIDVGRSADEAKSAAVAAGVVYPILGAQRDEIEGLLAIDAVPTTLVVDADGEVAARYEGTIGSGEALVAFVGSVIETRTSPGKGLPKQRGPAIDVLSPAVGAEKVIIRAVPQADGSERLILVGQGPSGSFSGKGEACIVPEGTIFVRCLAQTPGGATLLIGATVGRATSLELAFEDNRVLTTSVESGYYAIALPADRLTGPGAPRVKPFRPLARTAGGAEVLPVSLGAATLTEAPSETPASDAGSPSSPALKGLGCPSTVTATVVGDDPPWVIAILCRLDVVHGDRTISKVATFSTVEGVLDLWSAQAEDGAERVGFEPPWQRNSGGGGQCKASRPARFTWCGVYKWDPTDPYYVVGRATGVARVDVEGSSAVTVSLNRGYFLAVQTGPHDPYTLVAYDESGELIGRVRIDVLDQPEQEG